MIEKTSNRIIDLIRDCGGLITEQGGLNSHAAIVGITLNKPVIVDAKNATTILKNGITVQLDAQTGMVSRSQ